MKKVELRSEKVGRGGFNLKNSLSLPRVHHV